MTLTRLDCGFIPLVDCAALVVAREMGFAEEEGLDLVLHKEPTWSALRDKLALGVLDAAHMLAPVPVAMSMGLGGMAVPLDVLLVLSVNGNTIGASRSLSARMRAQTGAHDFLDAEAAGRALIDAADSRLRIGVPFPFSMHAELLYYWLQALGLQAPKDLDVRTVPPPRMAHAVAAGEIDAFCVGEPWGSMAVEAGVADLVLPGCAIWRFAPEKVLTVRRAWAEEKADLAEALMRAVWRAARWLAVPDNLVIASELLSRPHYVDVSTDIIDRALTGRLEISSDGEERRVPQFLEFFECAAPFPWRSQAAWIATRLSERMGMDRAESVAVARGCFRSDLYRSVLGPLGAETPAASEKLEGSLTERVAVGSSRGRMVLGPDFFFDHKVFDPAQSN